LVLNYVLDVTASVFNLSTGHSLQSFGLGWKFLHLYSYQASWKQNSGTAHFDSSTDYFKLEIEATTV